MLQIAQNQALFSLLGVTYGGDGQTTFGLPNLTGRFPMGASSDIGLGTVGGATDVTLGVGNLPSHTHDSTGLNVQQNIATGPNSTTLAVATTDSILGSPNFADQGSGSIVRVNAFAAKGATPAVTQKIEVTGAIGLTGGGWRKFLLDFNQVGSIVGHSFD